VKNIFNLIEGFVQDPEERGAILGRARGILAELEDVPEQSQSYAKLLVHTMSQVVDRGLNYATTELERIHGLMRNPSTPDTKKPNFARRQAVLRLFQQDEQDEQDVGDGSCEDGQCEDGK
jgi:Endoplasmic reticulum protein ERp29, C-terminal domain